MDYRNIGDYFLGLISQKFSLDSDSIINKFIYIEKNEKLQKDISSFLIEIIDSLPLYQKQISLDYLLELYTNLNEGQITNYIYNTPQNELYSFYDENIYFKKDLINNYINALISNNYKLKQPKSTKKEEVTIKTLPDLLRESYDLLYTKALENGSSPDDFASIMQVLFEENAIVETNDKIFNIALKTILNYKEVFLRLMYADLLINLNGENIDHEFDEEINYILDCHNADNYELPENKLLAHDIFLYMATIGTDQLLRFEVKEDADEDIKRIYQEINPFYIIEDVDYLRG